MSNELGTCLAQTTTLRKLSLRGNPLGADGVRNVMKGLRSCVDYQIKREQAAAKEADDEAKIAKLIKERPDSARSVDSTAPPTSLSGDGKTGAAAASSTATAARTEGGRRMTRREDLECPLWELDLSNTDMTTPKTGSGASWLLTHGIRELCDFLMRPDCRLKTLRIAKNRVNKELTDMLLTSLRHNTTLCSIDMDDCGMGPDVTCQIVDICTTPGTTQSLALNDDAVSRQLPFTPPHRIASRAATAAGASGMLEASGSLPAIANGRSSRRPALMDAPERSSAPSASSASSSSSSRHTGDTETAGAGTQAIADTRSGTRDAGSPGSPGSLTTRNAKAFPHLLYSGPSHIQSLSMRGCKLGDSGAEALRPLLTRRCRLRHIGLARNKLTARGARSVMLAARTSLLQSLDISNNTIGSAGAREVASALRGRLIALRSLRVAFCDLTDNGRDPSGVLDIAESIKENRTLMHLDLSGNSITLQRMGFHPLPLVQTAVYALADALRDNRTLLTLNLSRNWIGLAGQRALREAIQAQGGAVPFAQVTKEALQRWLEAGLWARVADRHGAFAPSAHPILAPVYRGIEGGARFERGGADGPPLLLGTAGSHRAPQIADARGTQPRHARALPALGSPFSDATGASGASWTGATPLLLTHGGLDAIPEASRPRDRVNGTSAMTRWGAHGPGGDPAAAPGVGALGTQPGANEEAATKEDDSRSYGTATLSLSEALALAAAGPSREEYSRAVEDVAEAGRKAEAKREEEAKKMAKEERLIDATTRARVLPSMPSLDFSRLPQRRRNRLGRPKPPKPPPRKAPPPPARPLPKASKAAAREGIQPPAGAVLEGKDSDDRRVVRHAPPDRPVPEAEHGGEAGAAPDRGDGSVGTTTMAGEGDTAAGSTVVGGSSSLTGSLPPRLPRDSESHSLETPSGVGGRMESGQHLTATAVVAGGESTLRTDHGSQRQDDGGNGEHGTSDDAWFFGAGADAPGGEDGVDEARRGGEAGAPAPPPKRVGARARRASALVNPGTTAHKAGPSHASTGRSSHASSAHEDSRSVEPRAKARARPPMLREMRPTSADSARSDWSAGGGWADSNRAFDIDEAAEAAKDDAAAAKEHKLLQSALSKQRAQSASVPGRSGGASEPRPRTSLDHLAIVPETHSGVLLPPLGSAHGVAPVTRDWRMSALRAATAQAAVRDGAGSPLHSAAARREDAAAFRARSAAMSSQQPGLNHAAAAAAAATSPAFSSSALALRHDSALPVSLRLQSSLATPAAFDHEALAVADRERAAEMEAIAQTDALRVSVVRERWDKVAPGYAVASQQWLVSNVVDRVFSFLEEPREVYFDDDRMQDLQENMFATRNTREKVRAAAAGGTGVDRGLRGKDGKMDLGRAKDAIQNMEASLHGASGLRFG